MEQWRHQYFFKRADSKFGAHRYEERVSVHLTSIRRVFPRFQSFGVAQPLVLHQKYSHKNTTNNTKVKSKNALTLHSIKSVSKNKW